MEQLGHELEHTGAMVARYEIEAVVNPKDTAEGSLGTDKTKINFLKADAKPKIKLQNELEGWWCH